MTNIIKIAEKAGFYFHDAGYAPILHTVSGEYSQMCFERFAEMIRKDERDSLAKTCMDSIEGFGTVLEWSRGYVQAVHDIADGIKNKG